MKTRKILAMLMVLVISVFALSGCGKGKESGNGEPVKFKLAFSTWVGYGPFFIAQEKGFFEKYGVDPEITIIDDESQFAAALASDAIQSLAHVLDREVISAANDVEVKVVLALDESSGGDGIVASGDIQTPDDLVGKTVALDKSSTSYFFFLTVLQKAGLSEDQMTISDMGADAAGTAFVQGEVDAAVTWEPWLTNAGERDGGHLLVSSADYPGTIVDTVSFNQKFVDANPEAIEGFCKAWFDAVEYYKENPDEGNKIMADGLAITEQDVADMVTGVTFYGASENQDLFDEAKSGNLFEVADRATSFWLDLGIIEKGIDAKDLLTSEYIK